MLENESMETQVSKETKNIQGIRTVPDPEVREKAVRRKFTAEHKLRILKEAESCMKWGQIGAMLRREGLYSSNLTAWRQQFKKGTLKPAIRNRRF